MRELAQAAAELEATTTHAHSRRSHSRSERMHRGCVNLQQSLDDAARAAAAARPLAARAIGAS
jgi:hypothetical protein